jgi:hypothetical protein
MGSSWLQLAGKSPLGRICLHVVAMTRDRQIKWHWAGICRELSRPNMPLSRV